MVEKVHGLAYVFVSEVWAADATTDDEHRQLRKLAERHELERHPRARHEVLYVYQRRGSSVVRQWQARVVHEGETATLGPFTENLNEVKGRFHGLMPVVN